ncbi:MAG: protein-L-isoaspartate O-methyltransferase [Pseudomonadota bacterium]
MVDYSSRRTMMVDTQIRPSDVTKFPIIDAMLDVPREAFVPDHLLEAAYVDENLAISDDRILLEPRTFAKMLDALDIQPTEAVLDLGCGLGYSTAILARLSEAVVAVEEDHDLAEDAQARLSGMGVDNAAVVAGALAEGAATNGPYDVIVVQGGVEAVPEALTDQLRDGGRIACVFMEGALGVCRTGSRNGDSVTWRFAFNASAPVLDGFFRTEEFAL